VTTSHFTAPFATFGATGNPREVLLHHKRPQDFFTELSEGFFIRRPYSRRGS
jgi:hypothetical protein